MKEDSPGEEAENTQELAPVSVYGIQRECSSLPTYTVPRHFDYDV